MNHKSTIFTTVFVLICTVLLGQSNFLPKSLGNTVNTVEYAEINPVISPDGKTLYFVRVSHPDNSHDANEHFGPQDSQDIWFSQLQADGSWSEAKKLDNLNLSVYNAILSIADNGKTVLINGVYNKKNRWIKRGLSVSNLEGDQWGKPQKLKIPAYRRKNEGKASNSYMSGDGKVIFMSFTKRFNGSKQNLYVSTNEDGDWSKPRKLPKNINDRKSSEEAPYFNVKEQQLYYSSNPKAENGKEKRYKYDIYVTKQLDNTFKNWSNPVLLSDTINSKGWDSYYKKNAKGSWAYFASIRDSSGTGQPDIFRVKLFEENPFVVVTGKVLDSKKNTPIDVAKYPYQIISNGKAIDTVKTDSAGNFVIKLPLGKDYVLSALAKNHKAIPDTIKAKKLVEYTELKKDLLVEPMPFVLVQGKILVRSTQKPLPSNQEFVVQDGKKNIQLDSIDYQTGRYTLKLDFGKNHQLSVKTADYIPEIATIDLTKVDEYKEINRDLYVQKVIAPEPNVAIISGRVIDKKTMLPINSEIPWTVNADEIPVNEINIDPLTGSYKMKVAMGKIYLINAIAEGYYPVYEMVNLLNKGGSKAIKKDLIIAPVEVGVSIQINNIFFETGKTTLKDNSFPELERLVKFLKSSSTLKVQIEGHTDNVGKAAANLKLSQGRAEAVVDYLLKHGITPDRLIAKGFGMTKPVGDNNTKLGKSQNRRVEFTILSK